MIINSVISGGGGEQPTGDYTVKVIDYDGTVLLETKGNTGDVIELPTAPTHDKLVFQEWSASVAVTNNTVTIEDNDVMVGAVYKTASGQSEFDITLTTVTGLSVTLNMDGTKDWGDGARDTATTHTYTDYGDYTITCDGTTINGYLFGQDNTARRYNCIRVRLANLTQISYQSFSYCYSLTKITIPSSVITIGSNAFYSCYSLANVIIPSNVTSIPSSMLYGCYSLLNVIIPSNVTSINTYAFAQCYSLSNIVIPSGVTSFGDAVFQECYSLSKITIPSGVTSFGNSEFNMCYSLSKITIPSGITSIGNTAFGNCYSLAKITIPSGITSIGNSAFTNCYSLASLTIPSNVTSIYSSTFQSCRSITKYDFSQHTSVPTLSNTNAFTGINGICKIIVPDSLYDSWIAATNWSTYADYIYKVSEVQ